MGGWNDASAWMASAASATGRSHAWIHVRASNTEPLLRMAAEARAEELCAQVVALCEAGGPG